jgi:tetratricopeptide (TPR) repeat protein
MNDEPNSTLLIRAIAAYKGVVADPRAFGPIATRLVRDARRAEDVEALVAALRAEAWFERARMANRRSKVLLDEAVRLARRHQLQVRLGEVLVTRAAVNHELGRLPAARRDLDHAALALNDRRPAELDLQRGALLQNLGRLSDAAAVYRRVLRQPMAPISVKAIMANNLALIDAQHGRLGAATAHLDQATELASQVGPAVVALVAQTRGWVTMHAGRLVESLRQFDTAARLYEAAGLSMGEPYLEQVDALADLRLLPEASEMARRAVAHFEAGGVLLMGAEAQLRTARLTLLAGDHAGAAGAAAAAARQFRQQGRTAWAARATAIEVEARVRAGAVAVPDLVAARRAAATLDRLGMLSSGVDAHLGAGRAALALGRSDAAASSLRRARELSRRAPVLVRLKGHVAAVLEARLQGRDTGVLQHCRAGLSDLTAHRAALPSMELRALASGHGVEFGRLGLEVVLRSGSATRVLEWMERTRAAALLAVEPATSAGIEEELGALRAVSTELARARHEDGEPPALLAKLAEIERRLRRAAWERQADTGPEGRILSAAELRGMLDGQVLVEYGALDHRLMAVVLDARRIRLVPLGRLESVQDEAEAMQFALRRLARPRSATARAGARYSADLSLERLTSRLIGPLGLPRDASLVVVPSVALQRIPWSALHPVPVAVAPSASFWARTRRRRPPAGGRVVLVAGPDLSGAAAEVRALQGLHRSPTLLAPPASTVAAVVDALDGAALAHLACHGRLRSDNPTFSSLSLSDGPLTVHELELRGVAPHRIILAACDSAADVGYAGDEMLGFVSALMARGTAGLVASMVMVPDVESVSLMRALHERTADGATLSEALHGARSTLATGESAEFVNWCAFTAFGGA